MQAEAQVVPFCGTGKLYCRSEVNTAQFNFIDHFSVHCKSDVISLFQARTLSYRTHGDNEDEDHKQMPDPVKRKPGNWQSRSHSLDD